MVTLSEEVRAYLDADGYTIVEQTPEYLERGWRSGPGGTRQYMNVWLPDIPRGGTLETQEGAYRERFRQAGPATTNVMLVPSTAGIRTEFRREMSRSYGVTLLTPIQLFDADFRWEANDEAASIAKGIRDEGARLDRERISQPFTVNSSEKGDDLVDELFNRFTNPDRRGGIHIVQGPAGIGKTWLFSSLYARLHDAFMKDKRGQLRQGVRPFALVPEYDPTGRRLSDLLSSFINREMDRPIRKQVLDWLVASGRGILMLDGLEEIMTMDGEFADEILEYFTFPNTEVKPTVLICLRDSLMNRNQAVIDFCTEYEDRTTVYTLEKWGDHAIRAFATRKMPDQQVRMQFINSTRSDSALHDLASLPYFCNLLVDEFNNDVLPKEFSPAQLIERSAESIVRREYAKKLALTEEVMPLDDVLTFAQDLARKDMEGGFHGISPSEAIEWARNWAELVLPEEGDARGRFEMQMSQMAFFERGVAGRLKFVHEILELYLIGLKYIDYLRQGETSYFIDSLNHWEFPADSITLDLLAEYLRKQMKRDDIEKVTLDSLWRKPKALKNILQLLNNTGAAFGFLGQSLERQDLSGLRFSAVDFSGFSFAGSNLDTTEFRDCNLRGADFSGAIISNTGFLGSTAEQLEDADFGNINTIHSIRVSARAGTRTVGEPRDASDWLRERVKASESDSLGNLPCPAAHQLRHLFGKFIRPDGMSRRTWVGESAIGRGARYMQDPGEAVRVADRAGYITWNPTYSRYDRAAGTPKYPEMVEFVREFKASTEIRFLLDEICGETSCRHIIA